MSPPQSITTSPDIPFHGLVETTGDALRLIQAARQGAIPRITRRLNDEERAGTICSGAVFIFSVEESGIRRWTEGLSWSASRIAGNFLLYRELLNRNNGRTSYTGKALSTDSAFSRRRLIPRDQDHQPAFKPDGLTKKTITISADRTQYHLISYYSDDDVRARRLQRPSNRPDIMALGIPTDLLDATNFRYPPRVEMGPNGNVINIRDADETDTSPISDFHAQSSPSQDRNPLPSLRAVGLAKTESPSFILRSSRRPRAIRPAKQPCVASTPAHHDSTKRSASEAYASPGRAESVVSSSPPQLFHDTSSPTSSFSEASLGSPSASPWQEGNSRSFAGEHLMSRDYGNQSLADQFQMLAPSSAPPSSFSFSQVSSSRRDTARTHSYPPASPPDDPFQPAYYYPQRIAYQHYQQSNDTMYQTSYEPNFPYSPQGYSEPYEDQGRYMAA